MENTRTVTLVVTASRLKHLERGTRLERKVRDPEQLSDALLRALSVRGAAWRIIWSDGKNPVDSWGRWSSGDVFEGTVLDGPAVEARIVVYL